MITVFNGGMLSGRAHCESSSYEGEDETSCEAADKDLEPAHVAAADTLWRPWTVVIKALDTEVAESTVLCIYVLPCDNLALLAEFLHAKIQSEN